MNIEAQRAHLRLLEAMPPERKRTHSQIFREENGRPGVDTGVPFEVRQHRRDTVRKCVGAIDPRTGKPWRYEDIAHELGISKGAVARYARVTGVAPCMKGKR